MNSNELQTNLRQFIGTEHYYRLTSRHLLTDGTQYLAEQAGAVWLMVAVASHLTTRVTDHFAVVNMNVTGSSASLTLDDGNGHVFAKQFIEYTDFPLPEMKLYCCHDGETWVIMLTSEY